jgi:ABC-2 type transport system permease protein
VRTPEVVNNASFMVIFPLTFASNAFVPLESFPVVLQHFAEWNPVSTVVQAARELFGNTVPGAPVSDAWPMQNPVLYTLLWTAIILAVFVPLSVRAYRRTASR